MKKKMAQKFNFCWKIILFLSHWIDTNKCSERWVWYVWTGFIHWISGMIVFLYILGALNFTTVMRKIIILLCDNYLPTGKNEDDNIYWTNESGCKWNSLTCKFVQQHFKSLILIGCTFLDFMILTNQKLG